MDEANQATYSTHVTERHARVLRFLANHPDIAAALDAALAFSNAISFEIKASEGVFARIQCGFMWQIAADYHAQAVEHILAGELDVGFALLRMAAELARDAYVIGDNPELHRLWMQREERPGEYRKKFKFDMSIGAAKAVFHVYKLCSRYGVHGHMTRLAHSKTTAEVTANRRTLSIVLDQRAIYGALHITLQAFVSIHLLFCNALQLTPAEDGPYRRLIGLATSLQLTLDDLEQKEKNQAPS